MLIIIQHSNLLYNILKKHAIFVQWKVILIQVSPTAEIVEKQSAQGVKIDVENVKNYFVN